MKINILDAHDRLQHFKKQDFDIGACCQNLINKRPFGDHPFYIFAHARTDDDGLRKRMIWQPRLTKPKAQTNSMLFKAYPGSDNVKVIWIIPERDLWPQYGNGMLLQSNTVSESIYAFQYNRNMLEAREDDDLNDDQINAIYAEIVREAKHQKHMKDLYAKPAISEAYQSS